MHPDLITAVLGTLDALCLLVLIWRLLWLERRVELMGRLTADAHASLLVAVGEMQKRAEEALQRAVEVSARIGSVEKRQTGGERGWAEVRMLQSEIRGLEAAEAIIRHARHVIDWRLGRMESIKRGEFNGIAEVPWSKLCSCHSDLDRYVACDVVDECGSIPVPPIARRPQTREEQRHEMHPPCPSCYADGTD